MSGTGPRAGKQGRFGGAGVTLSSCCITDGPPGQSCCLKGAALQHQALSQDSLCPNPVQHRGLCRVNTAVPSTFCLLYSAQIGFLSKAGCATAPPHRGVSMASQPECLSLAPARLDGACLTRLNQTVRCTPPRSTSWPRLAAPRRRLTAASPASLLACPLSARLDSVSTRQCVALHPDRLPGQGWPHQGTALQHKVLSPDSLCQACPTVSSLSG